MRDNRSRDNEGRLYFFFKEQKKNMAKYLYKTSVATLMHDTLSTHSEMVSSSNKFGKQNNQKKKKKKKKRWIIFFFSKPVLSKKCALVREDKIPHKRTITFKVSVSLLYW